MRLILNGREAFIFKDKFFIRDRTSHYYARPTISLATKHFESDFCFGSHWRFSASLKNVIELAIRSSNAPSLASPPTVVNASKDKQLASFCEYWADNFGIHMDDKNRFYQKYIKRGTFYKKKNGFLGTGKDKEKVRYYSFTDLLSIYNSAHYHLTDAEKKYPVLVRKETLNTPKKYAYVTLSRSKKGFSVTTEQVVTNPI